MRLIALLALVACGPKAPPRSLYPVELPPLEPPEVAEVAPAPDELPTVFPYVPGERPPFVTDACLVAPGGRGLVLPQTKAVELYQVAELVPWWEARARIAYDGRAMDRAYADQVVTRQLADLEAREREARWIRWAVPVAVTAGIFLGAGAVALGDQLGDP